MSTWRLPDTVLSRPVLVTGGAGFIGSHLVDALLAQGAHVVVVDDFNNFYDPELKRANVAEHLTHPNYRLVEANLIDGGVPEQVVEEHRPGVVVHLAARAGVRPSLVEPQLYTQANVNATVALLEASRKFGVERFVFGSSSSVYGEQAKIPFSETDMVANPISPYAATKAAGELFCHTYAHLHGLPCVCLRFFTVYGPRQRPDLAIHKFARLMATGQPLPFFGDGSTERDYTYVDDIVRGVMGAMAYTGSPFEIINLGNAQTVSLVRLVSGLEQALGVQATLDRLPMQPGDVPRTFADTAKARRLLGFAPNTSLDEGLARFAEWFRTTPAGQSLPT